MHNRLEQVQRGIKQRYCPMRGFGSFTSAAWFCIAHDELRNHFRSRQHLIETVSLTDQRCLFQDRWGEVGVAAGCVAATDPENDVLMSHTGCSRCES